MGDLTSSNTKRDAFVEKVDELHGLTCGTEARAKIDEEVFVHEILPHLVNPGSKSAVPAVWIGIAGSPYSEVDLIKDGNVVNTVPPLMARPNIKDTAKNLSMLDIGITYEQKLQRTAAEADNFMVPVTGTLDSNLSFENEELRKRWRKLAEHYSVSVSNDDGSNDDNDIGGDDGFFVFD